jgi:hypothetical protein
MNDKLAQIISIVTYANDYLINNRLCEDLFNKKCFINYESVSFIDHNKSDIASKPIEWFKYLKTEGCIKVNTCFTHTENHSLRPDQFSEGILGGGGNWRFETIFKDYVRYWTPKYYYYPYTMRAKPYYIIYRQQFKKHQIKRNNLVLEDVKKQLGAALWNISEFAAQQGNELWEDFFNKAQDNLYCSDPINGCYHNDIIPKENFTLSEQQLIFSASKAWCFGLQGSWNSLEFKDKASNNRYLELSSNLYNEIINSILVVVNK